MIEKVKYGGKTYRKVSAGRYYGCKGCCFAENSNDGAIFCKSPNNFDECGVECFHWVEVKTSPSARLRSLESRLRTAEKKLEVLRRNRPEGNTGDRKCRTYMEKFFDQQKKVDRLQIEVKEAMEECLKRRKK